MGLMITEFKRDELLELINVYLYKKKIYSDKEIDELIPKLKDINTIIKNITITLYVSKESFTSDKCEILDVESDIKLYLFSKLLSLSDIEKIKVVYKSLTLKNKKMQHFFDTLIFIRDYLDKNTFKQTKFNAIFEDWKSIVKQVRKSAFNTLFPTRVKNLTFIPYNKSNTKIIQLKDISKSYLDLKDKHITIKCPICNTKYLIDKNNFEKMFIIKDNKCFFNCDHAETEFLTESAFYIDLMPYLDTKKHTKKEWIMFIINNYKTLLRLN